MVEGRSGVVTLESEGALCEGSVCSLEMRGSKVSDLGKNAIHEGAKVGRVVRVPQTRLLGHHLNQLAVRPICLAQ